MNNMHQITISKRIIAFILLISQTLMSCGSFNTPRPDDIRPDRKGAHRQTRSLGKENEEKQLLPIEIESAHLSVERLTATSQSSNEIVHLRRDNKREMEEDTYVSRKIISQESVINQLPLPTQKLDIPSSTIAISPHQANPAYQKNEEGTRNKFRGTLGQQKTSRLHRDQVHNKQKEAKRQRDIACGEPSKLALSSLKEDASSSQPKSEAKENTSFILHTKGNHQVCFNHPGAEQVKVITNVPVTSGSYPPLYLPVIYPVSQVDVKKLATCSIKYQQNRVHVCFPVNDPYGIGYVRIEDVGLKGGGKGIEIDVDKLINTIVSGYGFLGIRPEASVVNSWRPFLNEFASALARIDLDLSGPRGAVSLSHYDPGNMKSTFEDIVQRATRRDVRLANYGDAYNHIANEVRNKIKQRQGMDIDPSEYPTGSYEVSLQPNLFNMLPLSQEVNQVYAAREGSRVSFDLNRVLHVVDVVVTFNSSFSEFERNKRSEQEAAARRNSESSSSSASTSNSSFRPRSRILEDIHERGREELEGDIRKYNQEIGKEFEKAGVKVVRGGEIRASGDLQVRSNTKSRNTSSPGIRLKATGVINIRAAERTVGSVEITPSKGIDLSEFKSLSIDEDKEEKAKEQEGITSSNSSASTSNSSFRPRSRILEDIHERGREELEGDIRKYNQEIGKEFEKAGVKVVRGGEISASGNFKVRSNVKFQNMSSPGIRLKATGVINIRAAERTVGSVEITPSKGIDLSEFKSLSIDEDKEEKEKEQEDITSSNSSASTSNSSFRPRSRILEDIHERGREELEGDIRKYNQEIGKEFEKAGMRIKRTVETKPHTGFSNMPGPSHSMPSSDSPKRVWRGVRRTSGRTWSGIRNLNLADKEEKEKEGEEREEGQKLFVNPTGKGIRNDSGGLGHFGAPRRGRKHMGIDLSTTAGQNIVAPFDGRIKNKYGDVTKYPMVQIYPLEPLSTFDYLEILYVEKPKGIQEEIFRNIEAGDVIGTAADLQELKYPPSVGPHVHVQMWKGIERIDPTPFFFKKE